MDLFFSINPVILRNLSEIYRVCINFGVFIFFLTLSTDLSYFLILLYALFNCNLENPYS